MREATGNMWEHGADAVVITTNGFVKKNGRLAMGRGCAREARNMFPNLDLKLGGLVSEHGNDVYGIEGYDTFLFSFPVKHNWWEAADLDLIQKSAMQLSSMVDDIFWSPDSTIVMPRPGCGNGRRDWEDVRPCIELLDDRFIIYTFKED